MPNVIPALSSYNIPVRDRWVPKVRAGYFFIGDRQYYLYADKSCLRLEQCRRMRFALSGDPIGDVLTWLDGIPYTNVEIQGTDAVVNLQDIESNIAYWAGAVWDAARWGYFEAGFVLTDDTQVTFHYNILVWNAATHEFDTQAIVQHSRFRDAEEEYWLPIVPLPDAPIVITDDSKLPTDQRTYAIEFDTASDGRITFNAPRNYVPNPNFDAAPTGSPEIPNDWLLSGTPPQIWRYQGTGYVGQWTLQFDGSFTGKARAMIDMAVDTPVALSSRARMTGTGYCSGAAHMEMVYKDALGRILSTAGVVIGNDPDPGPYSLSTDALLMGSQWQTLSIVAGPDDDLEPTAGPIPTGVVEMEVRLWGTGLCPLEFDAVQLERNRLVSQYGYIGPSSTVEFEQDPTGIYTPDPIGRSWPYPELNHIDFNAASEEAHAGFLIAEEFSDTFDGDLDIGGIDDSDPTGVPRGIIPRTGVYWRFGRKNLPYARVCGRAKLRNRYPLRLTNWGYTDPVNQYQTAREPTSVLLVPPENTRRDVNDILHASLAAGETVRASAIFRDALGNPIMHEPVDITVDGTGSPGSAVEYTSGAGRVLTTFTTPTGTAPGESRGRLTFQHRFSGITDTLHLDVT
jgi:hypothetical protein